MKVMLNNTNTSNIRIAKNTVMLYIRMLVMMVVTLITSRIYLRTLGETDFGIQNIVSGIVLAFTFISSTMQIATQRFLNYEMGKGDEKSVSKIFNVSLLLYLIISLGIIVLSETIGLWFLNNKMNIPSDRMVAANWVYQFAIASFVFQMLRIPYNATIIAYEQMNFYAYFSIFEAILKLGAAFLVIYIPFDKLILVSLFTMIVYLAITICYMIYCNLHYTITKIKLYWDTKTIKKLSSFSGWSLYGSACIMGSNQGVDIVINLFWGVTVNAALGIASQLSHAINQLVSNFQVAYNPQLVKLYSQERFHEFFLLIQRSSKFSFFLLLYAFIPLFFCSDYILELWLGKYPAYTLEFVRLMLIYVLIDSLQAPLWLSVIATGKIKQYHLITGTILLLNIPIIYLLMSLGLSPLYAWGCRIFISVILFIIRLLYLHKIVGFVIFDYLKTTILPAILVLSISILFPIYISNAFFGLKNLIIVFFSTLIIVSLLIFSIGMKKNEKASAIRIIKNTLKHEN